MTVLRNRQGLVNPFVYNRAGIVSFLILSLNKIVES